jgi:hypothetical protein
MKQVLINKWAINLRKQIHKKRKENKTPTQVRQYLWNPKRRFAYIVP